MVGVYCVFLNLEKRSQRRQENIAILSLVPKAADLASVMNLVTDQLRSLTKGVTVLDLPNATSAAERKEQSECIEIQWTTCTGKGGSVFTTETKYIPFKEQKVFLAQSMGDSVGQVVMAGCRSIRSVYFCRYCMTNQGSTARTSTVYDVTEDVRHFAMSMNLYIYVTVIYIYIPEIYI